MAQKECGKAVKQLYIPTTRLHSKKYSQMHAYNEIKRIINKDIYPKIFLLLQKSIGM